MAFVYITIEKYAIWNFWNLISSRCKTIIRNSALTITFNYSFFIEIHDLPDSISWNNASALLLFKVIVQDSIIILNRYVAICFYEYSYLSHDL